MYNIQFKIPVINEQKNQEDELMGKNINFLNNYISSFIKIARKAKIGVNGSPLGTNIPWAKRPTANM